MTPQVLSTRDTPYKGLLPYDEADAAFFFGRETESDIITANLLASRLTVLYGASGVGKSSVLRAEVAHHLRELAREEFDVRGQATSAISIYSSWTDDPLAGLRSQIAADVELLCGQSLSAFDDLPFHDFLAKAAKLVGGKLLIVLDQFEEYFIYSHREGPGSFATEFVRAVNSHESGANFLISIREDWLARLDRFKTDIPNLFDNYLRIDRLDHESALEAIEGPARKYEELRKPTDPEVVIAPGFSEAVLSQLERLANKNVLATTSSGEASDKRALDARIQTPYLQLVMTRLWSEALIATEHVLSPAMLAHPDRCEQIIQSHLDEVMDRLQPAEKDIAARVFKQLVTPSGTKFAQAMRDLAGYAEVSRDELSPVLKTLSRKETGVLTEIAPSPGQTDTRYEISTDVLAAAILDWRRRYVDAQEQLEIAQNLSAESARAESEARSARKFRRLTFAMVFVSLIAFATAAYALSKRSEAAKNRAAADKASRDTSAWADRARASEERAWNLYQENERAKTEFEAYKTESIKEIERQKDEAAEATKVATQKTAEAKRATQAKDNEQFIRRVSNEANDKRREGDKAGALNLYRTTLDKFPKNDPGGLANMLSDIAEISKDSIIEVARKDARLAYDAEDRDAMRRSEAARKEIESRASEATKKLEVQRDETRRLLRRTEFDLTQASDNYRKAGDPLRQARTQRALADLFRQDVLAWVYEEDEDREKSETYYKNALAIYRDLGNVPLRLQTLRDLVALTSKSSKDRAVKYLRELRSEYKNDPKMYAETTVRLGDLHLVLVEKEAAFTAYLEALDFYTRNGFQSARASTLGKIAHAHITFDEKPDAIKRLNESLAVLESTVSGSTIRVGSQTERAATLRVLARLKYQQKEKLEAYESFEKAARLYVEATSQPSSPSSFFSRLLGLGSTSKPVNLRHAAETYGEVGDLYLQDGERTRAIVSYTEAAKHYETIQAWKDQARALAKLSEIYALEGDEAKAQELKQKAREAERRVASEALRLWSLD